MHKEFSDIINLCRKPNVELLKEALSSRQYFSESESNFITYMAGFSHYEFSEELFPLFNFFFVEGTQVLADRMSNKLHIKILIGDQSHYCNCLHLGSIERSYNSPMFGSRMAFRDQNGVYIDSLGKELRGKSGREVRDYIAQGVSGVSENVVSSQSELQGYCIVTHFVAVAEPNIDINLSVLLNRVTACVFVNPLYDYYNFSPHELQKKIYEINNSLKAIRWYVLNTREPEILLDFLKSIKVSPSILPYLGRDYNYLQDFMSEIDLLVMDRAKHYLEPLV